jgi:hypothetical protein
VFWEPPRVGTVDDVRGGTFFFQRPRTTCLYLGQAMEGQDGVAEIDQFFADTKSESLLGFAIIDPVSAPVWENRRTSCEPRCSPPLSSRPSTLVGLNRPGVSGGSIS